MLTPFSVCGVGIVHSFMRTHVSAPRQPSTKEFLPQSAVILLKPGLENAVRDLQGFERIWVLFHFSYAVGMKQSERDGSEHSTGFKTMIVPPRDTVARGVFATRSPHRPNGIGLSCVRLVKVQGLEVHIADHDLLHGTPVLDIKPYLPFCDAHPHAKAGWVQELDERGAGLGDHRGAADASIAVHRNFEHRTAATAETEEDSKVKLTRHA
jgi:tRNA-Thr(GGU) m(6)t(6)A37 methyltransferase TsaA